MKIPTLKVVHTPNLIPFLKQRFQHTESTYNGTSEVYFFHTLGSGNGLQIGFEFDGRIKKWVRMDCSTLDDWGVKTTGQVVGYFNTKLNEKWKTKIK